MTITTPSTAQQDALDYFRKKKALATKLALIPAPSTAQQDALDYLRKKNALAKLADPCPLIGRDLLLFRPRL